MNFLKLFIIMYIIFMTIIFMTSNFKYSLSPKQHHSSLSSSQNHFMNPITYYYFEILLKQWTKSLCNLTLAQKKVYFTWSAKYIEASIQYDFFKIDFQNISSFKMFHPTSFFVGIYVYKLWLIITAELKLKIKLYDFGTFSLQI